MSGLEKIASTDEEYLPIQVRSGTPVSTAHKAAKKNNGKTRSHMKLSSMMKDSTHRRVKSKNKKMSSHQGPQSLTAGKLFL